VPRPPKEERIQDRAARLRLEVRSNPYWRFLSEGHYIGYRRGARKGTWVIKWAVNEEGKTYASAGLGEADDVREADGKTILSYRQAFDKALHWLELQARGPATSALDPNITVRKAVDAYIERHDSRKAAQAGRAVRSTPITSLPFMCSMTAGSPTWRSRTYPSWTCAPGRNGSC